MAEKWIVDGTIVRGTDYEYLCSAPSVEKAQRIVRALEDAEAIREQLAALMMRHSLATGHGDTAQDLLKQLDWQLAEREKDAELFEALVQNGWAVHQQTYGTRAGQWLVVDDYIDGDWHVIGSGPDPRAAIRDALERSAK